MSQQIVNEWSYGDKNTNTWLHDGDVERSAADIVALASGVSGIADTFPAVVSAGILEVNAAGATQVAAIEGAGAEQVSLVGSAGAVQCSAVDSAGDAEIASLAGATSTYLGDIQDAGAVQIAAVGSAGSALITSMGTIRDEVVEAETLIVNALGGDEEGTAQEFIDQVVNAADNASAYASAASGYAVAASGYADSIVSGGYVTSSNVSELVDAAVSSGGFVTSGYVSSATVASAGVAAKIGTSTVGSTAKPVYISAGVPVSMSVVDSATNASSLGGVAAASYALDANVVKLSGNQEISGVKTFTNEILSPSFRATSYYALRRDVNDNWLTVYGGKSTGEGAYISLFGKDTSPNPGRFILAAVADSSSCRMDGTADGSLTWGGKSFVYASGDQEITGSLKVQGTGNVLLATHNTSSNRYIDLRTQNNTNAGIWDAENNRWMIHALPSTVTEIQGGLNVTGDVTTSTQLVGTLLVPSYYGPHRDVSDDLLRVYGGGSTSTGPCLDLCGSTRSVYTGYFRLQSPGGTYVLQGTPAGNLSWNGTTTGFSSDIRIKQNIVSVPDNVLDAWGRINWSQFKYRDAVAEKGEEKARWHTGIIAQHVSEAMMAAGEDACAYGILCHEHWEADYDGDELIRPAGEQWMVRYTEALCMEAAYQRRRADRAEARISALERRLNEMEAVLASMISPVGDETYAEPEQDA